MAMDIKGHHQATEVYQRSTELICVEKVFQKKEKP